MLDPLAGYLTLAGRLAASDDPCWHGAWNFGPEPADTHRVRDLASEALRHWPGVSVDQPTSDGPPEAQRLSLSIDKARSVLGWTPQWDFKRAVRETVLWYRSVAQGGSAATMTRAQIMDHGEWA